LTRLRERLRRSAAFPMLLAAACATSKPVERPAPRRAVAAVRAPPRAPGTALYAPDEALADVLSGELQYLGTGRWPGIERSFACAFRNQRVVVVSAYCTVTEAQAFRIDVYSPERGRVRIYAEGKRPVSARQRADYFPFTAESEPPAGPKTRVPPLALTMSFQQLQDYDQQRYDAYLPGCYGGQQHGEKVGGCLGALASGAEQWTARNRAFLEQASADWYRVVRELRAQAARHGKDPL